MEQEATKLANLAVLKYQVLHNITTQHLVAVQRRWLKKSKKQRQDLLLQAWGRMPEAPCEDLRLFREGITSNLSSFQRSVYLLPQINLEQLRQDTALPAWLFSRGQNPPHIFLRFDASRTKMMENGTEMMKFPPMDSIEAFLAGGRLMEMNIDARPELYGKIFVYNTQQKYQAATARDDTMAVGVGLLALEMQVKMIEFLVKMSQLMLQDMNKLTGANIMESPLWPDLPAGVSSLSAAVGRRVFDGPLKSDFSTLSKIIASSLEAKRDHLWAMREDPAYFENTVAEAKGHIPIHFRAGNDATDTEYEKEKDLNKKFPWLLRDHFVKLFMNLRIWTALHGLVQDLEHTLRRYADAVQRGKRLPREVAKALMRVNGVVSSHARNLHVTRTDACTKSEAVRVHLDQKHCEPSELRLSGRIMLTLSRCCLGSRLQPRRQQWAFLPHHKSAPLHIWRPFQGGHLQNSWVAFEPTGGEDRLAHVCSLSRKGILLWLRSIRRRTWQPIR